MNGEVLRRPMLSGHCANPSPGSHERCGRNGGGNRANPKKEFSPCPCPCHLRETYECGGCGRLIREAPQWPFDEDGEMRYTHIDPQTGLAIGEACNPRFVLSSADDDEGDEPEVDEDDEPEVDEFDALLAELDEEL